jgi:hypothetical protein
VEEVEAVPFLPLLERCGGKPDQSAHLALFSRFAIGAPVRDDPAAAPRVYPVEMRRRSSQFLLLSGFQLKVPQWLSPR